MRRITGVLLTNALMLLACSAGYVHAAETHVPTPEEFREQVRQFNESGEYLERQRMRPVPAPASKAVEQYKRAVSLHTKKGASSSELKEAASLYQAASDAGIPQASTNLALLYLEGKGVKKDVKKALSLLNMASKKNIPQADIALARLYLTGKDVKRDEKKGEWHLDKAAKTGDRNAKKMLTDYKEWKKKTELAMKQYQEILKKAQVTMGKPQVTSMPPLPTNIAPQPPAGLPFQPTPFPVIPGRAYLGMNQTSTPIVSSPSPRSAPDVTVVPTGNTVVSQPVKVNTAPESGTEKPVIQTQPKPAK